MPQVNDAEKRRIEESRTGAKNWRRWGPYLSERQWGTVREDYSPYGTAWDYFTHDQARSRAYRWGEDGLAGFCDDRQFLCLSLALWNGRDPILKERLFGLTNEEGNHGEDVKELYYYLDAVPSYAYAHMLYKLPQAAYPYEWLIEENAHRKGSAAMEFEVIDTGIFDDDRYFDVDVEYAKAEVEDVLMRITVHNRGPDPAPIHILPQAWFRNIWSWSPGKQKPSLQDHGAGLVSAHHEELGAYTIEFEGADRLLFCDNETNFTRLFGDEPAPGHFKDAFHDYVIHGRIEAVNAGGNGTKVAGLYLRTVPARSSVTVRVRLRAGDQRVGAFVGFDDVFSRRIAETELFYAARQKKYQRRGHAAYPAPGLCRNAVEQAVLRFQCATMAQRRSAAAASAGEPQAWPQLRLAPPGRGRCHVDAGQMGIPLVRSLGPRLPLRHPVIDRRGICQGAARTALQSLADEPEWRAAGL